MRLDKKEFMEVVRNTPLISIDLIIKDSQGRILLGLRKNQPAKNMWFVPGGRIMKNEKIEDAFLRITEDELGTKMSKGLFTPLGIYDHIYEDNFSGDESFGTHYVVLAHHVQLNKPLHNLPEEQHAQYRWFTESELLNDSKVHPNTKAYFKQHISISAI
jgi:colanic acid biosynthesis protein WcaH